MGTKSYSFRLEEDLLERLKQFHSMTRHTHKLSFNSWISDVLMDKIATSKKGTNE